MGILEKGQEYSRYYGNLRGVDFSSDHTLVHDQRLAYAVNMYKDYQTRQGQALETIPGFRRRVCLPEDKEVYGIHHFKHKDAEGAVKTKILIHAGTKLYLWYNYPNTIGVVLKQGISLPKPIETVSPSTGKDLTEFTIALEDNVADVVKVTTARNEELLLGEDTCKVDGRNLIIYSSTLEEGDRIVLSYTEGNLSTTDELFTDMNERRSTSFIFNNRLYIIDGKNYLVYDGESISKASDHAYIPTTYINIIPSGENADAGTEYEQRNILSPYFKHTFIADGASMKFCINDRDLQEITEVKVYGDTYELTDAPQIAGKVYCNLKEGYIEFPSPPKKPEEVEMSTDGEETVNYPEFYAGIEVTVKKPVTAISGVIDKASDDIENLITACTIATVYDNRVFFSGNPKYPNHVFYCGRNSTGFVDPTYFGILNYMQDGVGITPITGMITVADTLMVLKGDTQQDGSVFFHTPTLSGNDIQPTIYPSQQGLAGTGCLGACTNFLDDPVFISRLGLEAVGQLSIRNERAIEHRSSLIDAKLANMDLSKVALEEWNGYLFVLVDGKIFMADSRQKYTHSIGTPQYEWYYLEDIGVYDGQYLEYKYAAYEYDYLKNKSVEICSKCFAGNGKCTCESSPDKISIPLRIASDVLNAERGVFEDLRGKTANEPDENGNTSDTIYYDTIEVTDGETKTDVDVYFKVHQIYDVFTDEIKGTEALLCEGAKGAHIGGIFKAASILKNIDDNLFFGTVNGKICSFNFDKREDTGEIPPIWYSFDERAILSGCATKMDNCDVPHMTKTTVKKSTVIKTKTLQESAAKIKVRTNKKAYTQVAQLARINSSIFSFEDMDFSDFSFNTEGQSLYAVREKEKKWVEKQYYIYSDEFQKPFALYYVSYRYIIAGRYKDK